MLINASDAHFQQHRLNAQFTRHLRRLRAAQERMNAARERERETRKAYCEAQRAGGRGPCGRVWNADEKANRGAAWSAAAAELRQAWALYQRECADVRLF